MSFNAYGRKVKLHCRLVLAPCDSHYQCRDTLANRVKLVFESGVIPSNTVSAGGIVYGVEIYNFNKGSSCVLIKNDFWFISLFPFS
jgi:hypothetical protein